MGCGASTRAAPAGHDVRRDAHQKQLGGAGSALGSLPSQSSEATAAPRAARGTGGGGTHAKERYEFHEVLGKGGFGEVRRGVRRSDGKIVAIKTISKLQFKTAQDHRDMLTEVELMGRVKGHPNVVEQLDWYEDRTGFFVVCELANGGELMDRIVKLTHFSEKVAAFYFRQMVQGLDWCHRHHVVHRDLKPENFLLSSHDPHAGLKLTDFGLSASIDSDEAVLTEACGSAYYIAPEVFGGRYTKAVDVWGLGVILYLLLSGTVPFGAAAEAEAGVYAAIQRDPLSLQGPEWARLSPAAKELVSGLLEKDPAKRYTLAQALEHPWVTGDAAPDAPLDPGLLSSIVSFQAANKFKRKALELVASTLSAADVASLRAAFVKMDADNSGSLSFSEMDGALREAGLASSREAVLAAVKNMDTNGDGKVSWNEFLAVTAQKQLINYQNNMWQAFQTYDKNGDGQISSAELRSIFKGESNETIAEYIAQYDDNHDGKIDYSEFIRMLLPKDQQYTSAPA